MADGHSTSKKPNYKPIRCATCGEEVKRTSPRQRRCDPCGKVHGVKRAWEREKERGDEYMEKKRLRIKEWKKNNKGKISENGVEYRRKNADTIKVEQKKYSEKNADKKRIIHKNWRDRNKDKTKAASREYRSTEHGKKKIREYCNEREKTDFVFKLVRRIRARIKIAMKFSHVRKSEKTFGLLGMTGKDFQEYLMTHPSKDPTFSMENYGKLWVIDHIRPIASFDLTDPGQQKEAFHYTNCQPLGKEENATKGNFWKGCWWKDGKPFLYPCVIAFNKTKDCST